MYVYRMDMVQSRGKRGKKVTTLLLPEMVEAIETLVEFRRQGGVLTSNLYIFSNSVTGHLTQYQTITKVAKLAGCECPYLMTSTRFRKYLATVCQVSILLYLEKLIL